MTAGYTAEGQLSSLTDGVGNTVQIAYDGGDPASVTDPLGNTSYQFSDAVGRLIWMQDTLGSETDIGYSQLDELTGITDALGGTTAFAYDADRNLSSVTDANSHTTSYTYDSMDRRSSRTDPLTHAESYVYDYNGNLTQFTDRRGSVTVYQYDGLNRRTFAGFGYNGSSYQSTISYTYDAGNRLTGASDSIAGTIARTYDGLDRLTDEQTPLGEVSYTYDDANRRLSLTVVGQNTVSYSWDNANRLTGITQGTNSVSFSYDAANRRTGLTLPNGMTLAYSYDQDSRVMAMTWTLGGNQVGDLSYSYDADGRVIAKSGSFAQTNLPQAVTGNTFNAANEMTAFNGTTLSYDLNGNLTGDGTNNYSWDARNHLVGITGGAPASFVYDALGRRAGKTIGVNTTQFVYDGLNPVQELDGANPANVTANLLTGLNIDEYFARADSNGAMNFLTDALGSTLALADSSGAINTSYTYEPFGNTTIGGSNANPYQFTGRENDGIGLDFYRARYYSSTLQRFVSQDPIGFAGGDTNLYGYLANDPINWADPLGLARGDWWDPRTYPPIDWYERAYDIAQQELALHQGHNDFDDAMRHADWSRRMSEEIGPFTSWSTGVCHELQGMAEGQPMDEMQMDLHNNAVGRAAGEAGTDIDISQLQTSPNPKVKVPYPYK
jgi:RHS repeat-associated protein